MQWYNSKHKHFLNKESRNHFLIISIININNIAIWTVCSKTFLSRASDKILFFILQTRNKQRRVMVEGLSWPFLKNDLGFAILVQISNSMSNLIGPFSKKKANLYFDSSAKVSFSPNIFQQILIFSSQTSPTQEHGGAPVLIKDKKFLHFFCQQFSSVTESCFMQNLFYKIIFMGSPQECSTE